jgi:hypothetical protein
MFIGPEDKRVIASWASHYGWSTTVAKRNFTVYRALEWLAAVLDDQVAETEGWFWCQQQRICQSTGMSRPTVKAAIDALVEIDVVEHERRWLPQAESLCSWFRLKIPPSISGRVNKAMPGALKLGLTPPPPGASKSCTRRVKNFYAPSYMSKREILKRNRTQTLAEIQDKCFRRGLDPVNLPVQLLEIAETALKAEERAERKERRLRSAGVCDPLDVKLAAKRGKG